MLECLLVYFIGGNAHFWNIIKLIFGRCFTGNLCKGSCGGLSFFAPQKDLPTSCSSCFLRFLYLCSSSVLPSESWACRCGAGHGRSGPPWRTWEVRSTSPASSDHSSGSSTHPRCQSAGPSDCWSRTLWACWNKSPCLRTRTEEHPPAQPRRASPVRPWRSWWRWASTGPGRRDARGTGCASLPSRNHKSST